MTILDLQAVGPRRALTLFASVNLKETNFGEQTLRSRLKTFRVGHAVRESQFNWK